MSAARRAAGAAWVVVAALALVAAGARAQETSARSSSRAALFLDNGNGVEGDDGYGALQERLELGAGADGLHLSARLDGDLFLQEPSPDWRSALTLERAALEWTNGELSLLVGDTVAQLGHGLALSLRQVPEVGADLALRGARLDWQGARAAATALVGLANAANVDALTLRHLDDPNDLLAGGQLVLEPSAAVEVGALASLLVPRERLLPELLDQTLTGGAFLTLRELLGVASAELEVDAQQRSLAGVSQPGAAAFADLSASLGGLTLLVEGLWLADFELKGSRSQATGARFDYNQPPTLERADQEVQNTRDVLAGRARVDVPLGERAVAHLSQLVRLGDPRSATPVLQAHTLLGLELDAGGARGALELGARAERLGLDKLALLRDLVHLDSDALVPLGRAFALHAATHLQLWRGVERPFVRGSSSLGLELPRAFSVGAELGVDTQDPSPALRHLFLGSFASWAPTSELTVRAFAGSTRGGIRCGGGVCREVPPFSGARLELELGL